MKNKKRKITFLIIIILLILLALWIFFIQSQTEWSYVYYESLDTIERIEIVDIIDSNDFKTIRILSDDQKTLFFQSFEKIKFSKYFFGDPPAPSGYGIKINYKSGNFELISYSMCHYVAGNNHFILRKHCDKGELYNIIICCLIEKSI